MNIVLGVKRQSVPEMELSCGFVALATEVFLTSVFPASLSSFYLPL